LFQNLIKKVAKEILTKSIYPNQDELRDMTEEYVAENHPNSYGSLTKKRWIKYYEKEIYQEVSLYD